MRFGVVVFPGSNCDDDMMHVLGEVLGQECTKIWHKETSLNGFGPGDCIVLPGGFSYGDYLRAGAVARFSPVMSSVVEFAKAGGYVLGICNGFQVLCEAHLLPGALLRNNNQKFICKNIWMRVESIACPLTGRTKVGQVLKIPIAHAEGRYFADEATLDKLEANGQVLFRYCDADGKVGDHANPNGSSRHIAGICNADRNVFGLMPHPERAAEGLLGNTDGRLLLESLIQEAETPVS